MVDLDNLFITFNFDTERKQRAFFYDMAGFFTKAGGLWTAMLGLCMLVMNVTCKRFYITHFHSELSKVNFKCNA